ncbi:2-iminoacetate synthase ThiH [Chromatiaceae bacterium AAb-1]|nr:2-iminoacetate synthase ThiH [Chromatiaceae bacterium AAb-1]
MSFVSVWQTLNWQDIQLNSRKATTAQIEPILYKRSPISIDELQILLSPAARQFLPQLAEKARQLTRQRFGHTVQLFAPLYLSNLCANECLYCGFSMSQKVKRRILNQPEVARECKAIQQMGIDQVLVVTGEHETKAGMSYFQQMLPLIREHFSSMQLEVQPLATEDYCQLRTLGTDAVMVYQETYNHSAYQQYHLKGKKTDIAWRLDAPDRIAQAGIDKIGLGILLGLADWQTDAIMLAFHLQYLRKTYWKTRLSLSVPRIRPCSGGITPQSPVSDKDLVQLICAFRLFMPELEISLSTRESADFRHHIMPLAITSISAGSKTQPGGYQVEPDNLEQFSTEDNRTPLQVATSLSQQGFQPVWKDWDSYLGR